MANSYYCNTCKREHPKEYVCKWPKGRAGIASPHQLLDMAIAFAKDSESINLEYKRLLSEHGHLIKK